MNELTISTLKSKLNHLKDYFEKYNPENVEKIKKIDTYIGQQVFKIAVVANMSAGKSTFVNALFGAEVLPAYTHATTDCATFIHSERDCDKKAIIYFNDGKQNVELAHNTLDEIKNYAQKDEDCEDDKYKNVEWIDLYYPFKNLQTSSNEDFKILFVDTPGPNSTGNGYAQKHKDQTRGVLNDVDLALFLFDYEQLDANLSSDDQGLWNTIKKRSEGDKDFDVYFLLNKIDGAFEDNFKDIDTKDKEKFIEAKQNKWFEHEGEAIEKLRQAAINHGIENPKVYPLSSRFALLRRDENINFDEEDELEDFEKKHFKRLFPDNWEEKLIEYLGIEKLENDINNYITNDAKSKIINKLNNAVEEIITEEHNNLERRIETLKKPREEAETNLKVAKEFLENESKKLQEEMEDKSSQLHEQYSKEIGNKIDAAIEKELRSKIEELTIRTIYFAQKFAREASVIVATKIASEILLAKMEINLKAEAVRIQISNSIKIETVQKEMQNYMLALLQGYKNNYIDVKTDIKESYYRFNMYASALLLKYKSELEKRLNKTLDIQAGHIQTDTLEISTPASFDMKIPNSTLGYEFEGARFRKVSDSKWYNPFTWGDTKSIKVEDEKHYFTIRQKELLDTVKQDIERIINGFYAEEKQMHSDTIREHLGTFVNIFKRFRDEKEKEIQRLAEEIKHSDDSVKNLEKLKEEITKIATKEQI